MTLRASLRAFTACAAAMVAANCATTSPEPEVRTVEVVVTKPVPCPALAALGPEPAYSDTNEALRAASNLAERALLFAKGRQERIQRLLEYATTAAACNF